MPASKDLILTVSYASKEMPNHNASDNSVPEVIKWTDIINEKFIINNIKKNKTTRIKIYILNFIFDICSIALGFYLAGFIYLGSDSSKYVNNIIFIQIPLFLFFNLYSKNSNIREAGILWLGIISSAKSILISSSFLLLIVFYLKIGEDFSRGVFFLGSIFALFNLAIARIAIQLRFKKELSKGLDAILWIYDGVEIDRAATPNAVDACAMGLHPDLTSVVAINRLGVIAEGMDRVVVHCAPQARGAWVSALKTIDVPSEILLPEIDNFLALGIEKRLGKTSIVLNNGPLTWKESFTKRTFDIFISLSACLFLLPLFFLIALAIKLESNGPIFFRQERIGLGNRHFKIWKFRSMYAEKSDDAGSCSTMRDDARITRVGRVLRRTSIDELPQVFNILLGEMSLVGPRPHAIGSRAENSLFWDIDDRYWQRHVVKPGLTGLAQMRGFRGATEQKSDLTLRLQSDLEYVSNWSLLTDIRILLGTIFVVVHKNAF